MEQKNNNASTAVVTTEKKRKLNTDKVKIKVEGEENNKKGRGRGEATSWAQQNAMLECLENKSCNVFKLITGQATKEMKCVKAGAQVSATGGFNTMASYVNERCGTSWSGK